MGRGTWRLALAVSLLALGACGGSGAAGQIARDHAGQEASLQRAKELDGALDALEVRLYAGRARVEHWAEMKRRHGHVSALACQNAEMHARGMVDSEEADRERRRALNRTAVAAAPKPGAPGATAKPAAPVSAPKPAAPSPASLRPAPSSGARQKLSP